MDVSLPAQWSFFYAHLEEVMCAKANKLLKGFLYCRSCINFFPCQEIVYALEKNKSRLAQSLISTVDDAKTSKSSFCSLETV